MLELTCTQYTTFAAGAVPPPSNPPSAPESIIDYGTPLDSPTPPAPLAIHPTIHPAPSATTHPLSPTHIPLAHLPTPIPEDYVNIFTRAANYVDGPFWEAPTLLVLDTHSVRSSPPDTPPLPHTHVEVFIVQMEDEPGEFTSSSSNVLPRMDHMDEAPPSSNPASAPASDDESESGPLSDAFSHSSHSHRPRSACAYFFPSTNTFAALRVLTSFGGPATPFAPPLTATRVYLMK